MVYLYLLVHENQEWVGWRTFTFFGKSEGYIDVREYSELHFISALNKNSLTRWGFIFQAYNCSPRQYSSSTPYRSTKNIFATLIHPCQALSSIRVTRPSDQVTQSGCCKNLISSAEERQSSGVWVLPQWQEQAFTFSTLKLPSSTSIPIIATSSSTTNDLIKQIHWVSLAMMSKATNMNSSMNSSMNNQQQQQMQVDSLGMSSLTLDSFSYSKTLMKPIDIDASPSDETSSTCASSYMSSMSSSTNLSGWGSAVSRKSYACLRTLEE